MFYFFILAFSLFVFWLVDGVVGYTRLKKKVSHEEKNTMQLTSKFCKKCGKELSKEENFCSYCGAKTDISESNGNQLKLYSTNKLRLDGVLIMEILICIALIFFMIMLRMLKIVTPYGHYDMGFLNCYSNSNGGISEITNATTISFVLGVIFLIGIVLFKIINKPVVSSMFALGYFITIFSFKLQCEDICLKQIPAHWEAQYLHYYGYSVASSTETTLNSGMVLCRIGAIILLLITLCFALYTKIKHSKIEQ